MKVALDELVSLAAIVSTTPLQAAAKFASGYAAMGQGKADEARHCFEDACGLYSRSGAPFETGRTRIQLARSLGALGRFDAAVEEFVAAKRSSPLCMRHWRWREQIRFSRISSRCRPRNWPSRR